MDSLNVQHIFFEIFATYPAENEIGYQKLILVFAPLFSETVFDASGHYDFFVCVLNLFIKIWKT